jgi:hypothetical protein
MIFGRLDDRNELPSSRVVQHPHAVNDLPRHGETLPGGERLPRPVVPDPSRDPE